MNGYLSNTFFDTPGVSIIVRADQVKSMQSVCIRNLNGPIILSFAQSAGLLSTQSSCVYMYMIFNRPLKFISFTNNK